MTLAYAREHHPGRMDVTALTLSCLAVVLSLACLVRPTPYHRLRSKIDAYRLEVSELIDRVERINRREAKRAQREAASPPAAALPFQQTPLTRAQLRYAQLRERAVARAQAQDDRPAEASE